MKTKFLLAGLVVACGFRLLAAPLTESTFTEIVKEVNLVAATTKAATPAKLQDVLRAPDLVRTGPESRAELTAVDQTITRVGANTVFTFDTAGRSIDLQQGSLLFHSPRGKGGGTIKSGGAAAAVLGTTIIVAATPGGGFKVIVLEGRGRVTPANGKRIALREGQIIFILPGLGASEVLDLNLGKLVNGSALVNGFANELPSAEKIRRAVQKQERLIARGGAQDTGLTPENFARERAGVPMNGIATLDDNVYAMGLMGLVLRGPQTEFSNGLLWPRDFVQPGQSGLGLVGLTMAEQIISMEVMRQATKDQIRDGLLPPLPPTPLAPPGFAGGTISTLTSTTIFGVVDTTIYYTSPLNEIAAMEVVRDRTSRGVSPGVLPPLPPPPLTPR